LVELVASPTLNAQLAMIHTLERANLS